MQQLFRVETGVHPRHDDAVGRRVAAEIREALGLSVDSARVIKVFTLKGVSPEEARALVDGAALHDPVLQQASLAPMTPKFEGRPADFVIEVGFRPGVTDNEGHTARDTAALVLGRERAGIAAYTSAQYHLWGNPSCPLVRGDAERIAGGLLANELIQRFRIKSAEEWAEEPGFEARAAAVTGSPSDRVDVVPLSSMDDDALMRYSREHTLALSLAEMRKIRDWFARPEVREARTLYGLGGDPTDAEVEVLAQTWSEHCKHKIFAAKSIMRMPAQGSRKKSTACTEPLSWGRPPRCASGAARGISAAPSFRTMRGWWPSTTIMTCASRWRPTTVLPRLIPTAER